MTKFSEGLAPVGAKAKLYTTTADILRTTNIDVEKAVPRVVKLMQRDVAMLTAMSHDYANRSAKS